MSTIQRAWTDKANESALSYAQNSYIAIIETVIEAISQQHDPAKILQLLLPYALALTEAELGVLLVAGDNGNAPTHFSLVAVQDMPDDLVRQLTSGDLAGELLAGHQIWLEPQAMKLDPPRALLSRHKLRYLFGVPFLAGGEVLGAVVVGSRVSAGSLLGHELRQRLTMLAQLTGLFLENVRLHTRTQNLVATAPTPQAAQELEELLAAVMSAEEEVASQNIDLGLLNVLSSEVGSSLQLNAVALSAIERTRTALNAEVGFVYIAEGDGLTLLEQQGLSEQYVQKMKYLKQGDGVEGMAFSRGEPVLRDALLFHSGKARRAVEAEGLRTVAAAPLIAQGQTFGILAVAKHHPHNWSSRDERMLSSISQQVGQAIANARLFNQTQEKARDWESSYVALQQSNTELSRRAETLEKQVEALRQAEQQIWVALAASQKARRHPGGGQLVSTLKKALNNLDTEE